MSESVNCHLCLGSMSNLAHSVSDATLSGLSAATASISKANARKAPVDVSNLGTHMIDVSYSKARSKELNKEGGYEIKREVGGYEEGRGLSE